DVVLGEQYGLVRVTVKGLQAGGSANVAIELEKAVFHDLQGTSGEPLDAIVDRRAPLVLSASATGFVDARRASPPLTRSFDEEVVLELVPDASLATLEVAWTLPDGLELPATISASWRRGRSSGYAQAPATPAGCRFRDLDPGRYTLLLQPPATFAGPLE